MLNTSEEQPLNHPTTYRRNQIMEDASEHLALHVEEDSEFDEELRAEASLTTTTTTTTTVTPTRKTTRKSPTYEHIDDDITAQAIAELEKEGKRANQRADTMGVSGFRFRGISLGDRRYLNNTVIGTLQTNRRIERKMEERSGGRGGFVGGVGDDEGKHSCSRKSQSMLRNTILGNLATNRVIDRKYNNCERSNKSISSESPPKRKRGIEEGGEREAINKRLPAPIETRESRSSKSCSHTEEDVKPSSDNVTEIEEGKTKRRQHAENGQLSDEDSEEKSVAGTQCDIEPKKHKKSHKHKHSKHKHSKKDRERSSKKKRHKKSKKTKRCSESDQSSEEEEVEKDSRVFKSDGERVLEGDQKKACQEKVKSEAKQERRKRMRESTDSDSESDEWVES